MQSGDPEGPAGFPARKETCLFTLMSPINKLLADIALSGVIHSKVNGCQGELGEVLGG